MATLPKGQGVIPLPPFKAWLASNIPAVYDNTMTYYEELCALIKYITDQVIPALNENASAVTTLSEAVVQLQNYVDNYFANLDVQEEINNKLDQMVEDGTFQEIVGDQLDQLTQEVHDELDGFDRELTALSGDVDTLSGSVENLSSALDTGIKAVNETVATRRMIEYRKENYDNYYIVEKPAEFTESLFKNVNILTNRQGDYTVNYNKAGFINQSSTNTWYFSPDGADTNSGVDYEHAKLHINQTFVNTLLQSGDTIHIKGGYYGRDCPFGQVAITKGCNIICDDDVYVSHWDSTLSWTQYGNHTWYTTRSNILGLYDITRLGRGGKVSKLTLLEDKDSVDATPNSYCYEGSVVYIHMYNNQKPTINTLNMTLKFVYPVVNLQMAADDQKVYIKGLTILGGATGGIVCNANGHTGCTILLEDVTIYNNYADGYTQDSFTNIGFCSICDRVKIVNSEKDGFNYHRSTAEIQAYGIEIDCSVNNCGEYQFDVDHLSNNATTAHNACKVISVNGSYTLCNGGEVVDIDQSVRACYNCLIADSYRGRIFDAYAHDDAKMYLYDCYFKGSIGQCNIMTGGTGDAVIYISNCQYDTKQGNVIDVDESA